MTARRTAAERQRRYRQRQRRGNVMCVYRIEIARDLLINALLRSERLTAGEALRRQLVERACAEILEQWAARWLRK